MSLDGRVCIVTGAARGIGKGIGMRLVAEGASVVFGDIDFEQAEAATGESWGRGKAIPAQPAFDIERMFDPLAL